MDVVTFFKSSPGFATKAPSRPKRTAKKRRERMPQSVVDQLAARSRGLCEARLPGCTEVGESIHHRLIRKHRGPHSVANCLVVCRNCHTDSPSAIHRNPAASYKAGLLVRNFSAEADRLRGAA